MKKQNISIFLLIFLGIIAALYLTNQHISLTNGLDNEKSFCSISSTFDCDIVAVSSYSSFKDFSVASIGLAFYFVFLFLFIYNFFASEKYRKFIFNFLFFLSLIALIFNVFLFVISLLFIESLCLVCIFTYLVNIGLSFCFYFKVEKRFFKPILEFLKDLFKIFTFSFRGEELLIPSVLLISILLFFSVMVVPVLIDHSLLKNNLDLAQSYEMGQFLSQPKIDIDYDSHFLDGSKTSKVKIVEFSDFECPFCSRAANILKLAKASTESEPGIYLFPFPIDNSCNSEIKNPFHLNSCLATYAFYCAKKEGKQLEIYNLLFENQNKISREFIFSLAEKLNFEKNAFVSCLESQEIKDIVKKDIDIAKNFNINSTPTIFINGRKLAGNKLNQQFLKKLFLVVD